MTYTIYELLCFFVIYCGAGLGALRYASVPSIRANFVNRGFLNGPVCPIYGFGMVVGAGVL